MQEIRRLSVRDATEEKQEQKQARNEEIKIQKPGVSGRKLKNKTIVLCRVPWKSFPCRTSHVSAEENNERRTPI